MLRCLKRSRGPSNKENLAGFGLKEDAEYTLLSLKGAPSGNLTVITEKHAVSISEKRVKKTRRFRGGIC
jgi:hypothetical protein